MKELLLRRPSNARPNNSQLTGAIRKSLDNKYSQVVQTARHQWEGNFGKDPSDACVSVRISNGTLRDSRSRLRRALSYGL